MKIEFHLFLKTGNLDDIPTYLYYEKFCFKEIVTSASLTSPLSSLGSLITNNETQCSYTLVYSTNTNSYDLNKI